MPLPTCRSELAGAARCAWLRGKLLRLRFYVLVVSLYPLRRKSATFRNWTTKPFGGGNFRATPDRVYTVPIYFSGVGPPTTSLSSVGASQVLTAIPEGEQQQTYLSSHTEGATPRLLTEQLTGNMQGSDISWTAADFQEIYVGPSSMRTKIEALRSQDFLDWQLHRLEISWMSYNGDSGMFVLNMVS